jgi:hypothetical protein
MTRRQRTCAKVVRGFGSHMQRLCLRAQLHPATALDPPPPPLPPETQRQLCRQIRLAPAQYRHCRDCGQTDVFRR